MFGGAFIASIVMLSLVFYPFWTTWVANKVTIRDIESPKGAFTIPYETHGGTVYVDKRESEIFKIDDTLTSAISVLTLSIGFVLWLRSLKNK